MCFAQAPFISHNTAPRKSPADLSRHRCLAYNLSQDYPYWTLTDSHQEHRVKIHPYLKASTGEFLRDAAVSGQGIVFLPTFILYREIERGALVPVLQTCQAKQLVAYALYPQTRHLSHRVRVFVEFLIKRFAGTPYWDLCLDPV